MCAQDGPISKCLLYVSVCETLRTQPKRPFCSCIILSLDSAQPLNHIGRALQFWPGNVLAGKTLACDVYACHYEVLPISRVNPAVMGISGRLD